MKNRILSVVLTLCVLLNMCTFAAAAATDTSNYNEESAITLVKTLNIMVGDQNGNMNLDKNVSRAEFAKIAVAMSQYRNMVATTGTTSVFKDCTFKHWASPYVRVAVTNGIINGYPDGTFRPDNTVALEEAITVMLKLLGYTNDDFGTSWPYGQMGIAANQHILDNVDKTVGASLTRGDV
ncbi:MAG: S-layer homology domain-containing protein, partial [Clostridia bacterium]|nr:S-layer homology domain-containing protein [Clostridia bacterium]